MNASANNDRASRSHSTSPLPPLCTPATQANTALQFRIMFTVGSVGRHYRSIYRPTLGRYIGRVAVDTRSTYRPSVGRVSVEYRPNVGRVSADTSADMCVGRYGFSLVDTRPIPYRYFTDSLPIPYRYSVDTLPILGTSVG